MTVHIVRSGENLWFISNLYAVPIATVISVNGLTSTKLVPGLALYIPDNNQHTRSYQIKPGDMLWRVAQQFNTTVSSIIAANPGIDVSKLRIGQVITIPSPIKMALRTVGFFIPSGASTNFSTLDSLANQLTYIAIVNYSFTAQGWAYAQFDDSAIITRSRQLNISPLLMIRNFASSGFDAGLAGTVLGNATYRQNLIASIVNLARSRGFEGVSLDFEFIPPANRNDFTLFLQALKRQLGDLQLHVNVHAKTEDLPTNRIVGAYDYAAIGAIVDYMAVMTIDYGYPGGPPDPISPINWVEQVIKYARSLVDARKLVMAMALYGYDSVAATKTTRGISVLTAQNNALSFGSDIQYDRTFQSPWYRYWSGTVEHIVWFEDIRSYTEKYRLIDSYQLAGTTFWHIGLPAPQNWAFLREEATVIKKSRSGL
ncbi:glycosyl hydrolase family 18 protein [Bacillus sp. EB01]|uniref:glycosyl hydrolase family 18 protein n=1 Tax=Bacillus sp. EB01 TaxID=1347086 RepID=UPI0005C4E414|nr:glycosyl hydrolase family 18 protein [Bacillus sp. EB01]